VTALFTEVKHILSQSHVKVMSYIFSFSYTWSGFEVSLRMHNRIKFLYSFLLLFLFCSLTTLGASAQNGDLILEAEQHWETYGVGGACNHGTHNLYVADADGDGVPEIIVGAFMYNVVNGSNTPSEAPLEIWSWNGQNITLEKNHKWAGNIECVYVADADGDGVNEIFTAGMFRNETGSYSSLRAWHWSDEELSLEAHYEGVSINSICVSDVDKDGTAEIITVGRLDGASQYASRLCLWHFEQDSLLLKETLELNAANATSASSVYACDLDNNGEIEIVTGGYSGSLNNSKGQFSIWNWNGKVLSLKADEKWQIVSDSYARNIAGGTLGNTVVYNLKVGDVDGDGTQEIITGGFSYDGESANAQLRVWSWNGSVLTQESQAEWITDSITLVYCVSLDDVDGDSQVEIVTGGMTAAYGSFATNETSPNRAQLTVWGWNGTTLALEQSQDWTIGEGVCVWNVDTADLENDGTAEIITSGCMSLNRLCDPDMRIWSIQRTFDVSTYLPFVIAGIVAAAAVSATFFFVVKKRR
jgi:hypothetical protein